MYTQFFDLTGHPFSIAPDPRFMYASSWHEEGLAHLLYGIQMGGGFVALTGEVGTGKTLLCHCLLQQLPADIDMALILNPRLDAVELLASICDELAIQYPAAPLSLKTLVDALNKHLIAAHAQGKRTVVMIDEAQNLSLDVLEQIRLLTNLETTTDKLLQIILVGQPELQALLNRPALRQLNQRITARYHLQGLNIEETEAYILHRLKVCNGDARLFKPAAIRRIFKLSEGIPRLINRLCDRALLGAYALERHQVDIKIVNRAAKEVGLFIPQQRPAKVRRWQRSAFRACLAGLGFIGLLFLMKPLLHQQLWQPKQVVPNTATLPPKNIPLSIVELNQQQPLPLADALAHAFSLFSKPRLDQTPLDCEALQLSGLECFIDHSTWKEILGLNRPVILELELLPKQKIFMLLTGLKGDAAIFELDHPVQVPLKEVLRYWDGYYLLVWQPPAPEVKELLPSQTHPVVLWLRQKLAGEQLRVGKPDYFDQNLKDKVVLFQQQKQLMADGIVGARTFIQIQNHYQPNDYRHLNMSE